MNRSKSLLRCASSLVAGLVFGVGLALAQMTDPRKVLGFLDLAGSWDPSLLFVLGGAVALSAATYRWILKAPAPKLDDQFHLPASPLIDFRLLSGAAIFGMGWGLAGYCPGPAIASLGFGNVEALWLLPSLLVGVGLQRWLDGGDRRSAPDQDAKESKEPSSDVLDIKKRISIRLSLD